MARGVLLASSSFMEQEQVPWRSVFCSVFPRFLNNNKKQTVLYVFLPFSNVLPALAL